MTGVTEVLDTYQMFSLTRHPAERFFEESKVDGILNFDHFCASWGKLIELDMAKVLVYLRDDKALGIIGGTITKCLMTGDIIAQEAFWWVDPIIRSSPVGIRLFRNWENMVSMIGAKRIYVGNLHSVDPEKMAAIYQALGYKALETHYVRPV